MYSGVYIIHPFRTGGVKPTRAFLVTDFDESDAVYAGSVDLMGQSSTREVHIWDSLAWAAQTLTLGSDCTCCDTRK